MIEDESDKESNTSATHVLPQENDSTPSSTQLLDKNYDMTTHCLAFCSLERFPKEFPTLSNLRKRVPENHDFKIRYSATFASASWKVLQRDPYKLQHIIIVLCGNESTEVSLESFARAHLLKEDTACLLLRLHPIKPCTKCGHFWEDRNNSQPCFFRSTEALDDIIFNIFLDKCRFLPRDILLCGFSQSGTAALAVAITWKQVDLGGVISIGGPMPQLNLGDTAAESIHNKFLHTDIYLRPKQNYEWTTESVVAFDGGGIRGYGSLLILKRLMERIARAEQRADSDVASSFYPLTLIRILLSRFRIYVDDSLEAYRSLGGHVFGKPRPFALQGMLWHSFKSTFAISKDFSKTSVISYRSDGSSKTPYIFRTYNQAPPPTSDLQRQPYLRNLTDRSAYSIVDITMATSAAPTYFEPLTIVDSGGRVKFKDGGFGCNNPSHEAYVDIIYKHGARRGGIGSFINIGTGQKNHSLFAEGGRGSNLADLVVTLKSLK
ncbi:hypothetical protein G7Y89_g3723 [Cudoniella acicularis]|uniref:PNPLA domain-containing protein n=1 Tax=Cudoniella acicularis TaxID=354080 RepID=A0A8H4RSP0_9HELO|nr:hypothetical protein G7Y89_g3723 [Cudoniella acicularis]